MRGSGRERPTTDAPSATPAPDSSPDPSPDPNPGPTFEAPPASSPQTPANSKTSPAAASSAPGLRGPASTSNVATAGSMTRKSRRGQGKRITKAAPRTSNASKADLQQLAETAPDQPLGRTLLGLLRICHPKQAVTLGVAVGALILLMGRPTREAIAGALAVLLTQAALGILNDLLDREADQTAVAPNKPLASGLIAPGTAGFALFLVLLLAVPAALQSGLLAGLFLLSTLVVGYVHNRWLKRGPLSFVGWCLTFALYVPFLTYGVWGLGPDALNNVGVDSFASTTGAATQPTTAALLAAAALGLAAHFATALGDLVYDHRSGARTLPLRLGVKIGARGLLALTVILSLTAVVGFAWAALTIGLAA